MDQRKLLREIEAINLALAKKRAAKDPVELGKLCGLVAHPWQEGVLRSSRQRILLNCCRQAGKSTCAALLALHQAIFTAGSLVLIIAPSWRQSGETFKKCQDFLAKMSPRPDLNGDSKTEIAFPNGSRIVSLPAGEEKIRGFSAPKLIIIDEAGDTPDDLYHAILPMILRSRGRLLVMGTPKGQRGFFHYEWMFGGDRWERIEVPWTDSPDHVANPDEIAAQRAALGEKFGQEYECKFMRLTGGMIYSAFSRADNCIPDLPSGDWTYLLGLDFGFVDATSFVVVGWLPQNPVLYVHFSMQHTGLHADEIAQYVAELSRTYKFSRIIGDTKGYGKGPAEELLSRYKIFVESAPSQGKAGYIDLLNAGFAQRQVLIASSNTELIDQIEKLPWNDTRTSQREGFDDHMADALLYSFRVATTYLQKSAAPKLSPQEQVSREIADFWKEQEDEIAYQKQQDEVWTPEF